MNKYEEILDRVIEILKDKLSDEEQADWVRSNYVIELDDEIYELGKLKDKLEVLEKAEFTCGKSLDKIIEEYLQMKKVIEILNKNAYFYEDKKENFEFVVIISFVDILAHHLTEEEFNLLKEIFE